MLQLGFIRENREYVIERLGVKHFKDAEQIIDNVISQDNKRRNTQTELDKVKAEANSIAKQVGMLYKQGQKEQAEEMKNNLPLAKRRKKSCQNFLYRPKAKSEVCF